MEKLETSSTSESLKFINDNTKTDSVDSPAKLERQKTHLSLKRKAIRKLQFYCQQQEAKEWIEEVLNIKIKSESLQVIFKFILLLLYFIQFFFLNRNL